jgi:hypothetical protein
LKAWKGLGRAHFLFVAVQMPVELTRCQRDVMRDSNLNKKAEKFAIESTKR